MSLDDRIYECRTVLEKLETIDEEFSEANLEYYENMTARFYCNPYEGQIWSVVDALSHVDNLVEFRVSFAQDMDEDYDIIDIEWLE